MCDNHAVDFEAGVEVSDLGQKNLTKHMCVYHPIDFTGLRQTLKSENLTKHTCVCVCVKT